MKNISPFVFYCQKILPAVYEDSLSYYEVLCKVMEKLNEVITNTNEQNEAIAEIAEEVARYVEVHPDEVQAAVNRWLDEHPEATTTVQDGSITISKFTTDTKNKIKNGYITPEMFGATGDNADNDTRAFNDMFNSCVDGDTVFIDGDGITYTLNDKVYIRKRVHVIGSPNVAIRFVNSGCFYMSCVPSEYDNDAQYFVGAECRTPSANSGKCYVYRCLNEIGESETGHMEKAPAHIQLDDVDQTIIWLQEDNFYWTYMGEEKIYDVRSNVNENAKSTFENILFNNCTTVFKGDIRYLNIEKCVFMHCHNIFYLIGLSPNKKSEWYGGININDCDIRYCDEIFYLSHTNDKSDNVGLNAVTINGGVINDSYFFYQFNDLSNPHNYNANTRLENFAVIGCDVEKSHFFYADERETETTNVEIDWMGKIFLYNVVFNTCYIEKFFFIRHSASSKPMTMSTVTFNNCFMQLKEGKLINCKETTASPEGLSGETCFDINIVNCQIFVTSNTNDSLPIVTLKHTKYRFTLIGSYPQIKIVKDDVTIYAYDYDLKELYDCASVPSIRFTNLSGTYSLGTVYSGIFDYSESRLNQKTYFTSMFNAPDSNYHNFNLLNNLPASKTFVAYHPNYTSGGSSMYPAIYIASKNNVEIREYPIGDINKVERITFTEAIKTMNMSNWGQYKNNANLKTIIFRIKPDNAIPTNFFNGDTNVADIYVPWSENDAVNANIGANKWGATNATIHWNTSVTPLYP